MLANDSDGGDGGPFQINSVTQPAHGTVTVAADNKSLSYQPNANYCGTDSFTYTLNGSSTATVSVTVNCVDDPPVAVNDTKTVTADSAPALLTNRDFEVDTSGWASWNAPISRSTAEQHGGAASMRLDFNGTAWAQVLSTPFTAAGPNAAYTVVMWVKAPSGYRYSFGAIAIDASSAYISTFIGQSGTGTAPGSMSLRAGTLLLARHRFRSISLIPPAQPRRSTSMT